MKNTAVDWLIEKLVDQGLLATKDYKNLVAYRQAKQMEKKQIEEAFYDGYRSHVYLSKKYYKVNYKKK